MVRPGAQGRSHVPGGLSGDRGQRYLGVLSAEPWGRGCPKETVLFPDRKDMLQFSKDWRRAGDLPGML